MFVPVSQPLLGAKEKEYVNKAISKGDISGLSGTYIQELESSFAKFCGVKEAITVNSGTTALHLAVVALGIKRGDEVLVSSFTNMATFFAVLYQGAKPIPIDSEARTLNMDPKDLEKKITSKTKAIIVVHIYGHMADMDPIMKIARKYKLKVIEDAAEAHGAEYKGKKAGSIGDIGCFSFYSNKIITTGEGGALTTNNKKLADSLRLIKNLAFGKKDKFMHQTLGYKYQMTNLQAAVGAAQMTKIDQILKLKRDIAGVYLKGLKDIPEIQLPIEEKWAKNVYWMFNIVLRGKLSGKRREFMAELKKRGVDTREDFVPFNQQKIFIEQRITKPNDCPVINGIYDDGLYLPSGTLISKKELQYVIKNVREVVSYLVNKK
jgi:perosamine synthetase